MLHRFGFTLVALTVGAPCALAFGDDGKKDSVEGKLLEILRSRQVINDAEFGELTTLSARLRAEEEAEIAAPGPSFAASIRAAAGEGFTIEEGTFKLTIRNRFQTRFTYSDLDNAPPPSGEGDDDRNDTSTFSVNRPRTYLEGSVWDPDITFRISIDYNESAPIKDAWVNWNVWSQESSHSTIGLRMGQQKTRFGKLATASAYGQEFVDLDIATTNFAGMRSRGLMAHGRHVDGGKVNWHAGMFNSDTAGGAPFAIGTPTEEASNLDNELNYVFGARFDPMGDMGGESYKAADLERTQDLKATFGANLWLGNETVGGVDNEVTSLNLNAAMKLKGFHALGEVFSRSDDVQAPGASSVDSMGWNVQGTYTLQPNAKGHQFGFGGRYSMAELEDPVPGTFNGTEGETTDITLVVSDYYKGHNLKTQVDFTFRTIEPEGGPDRDDLILRVQFTMQI